ncbi:MAG: hypothetical protein RLZZ546_141, partial [Bacteroidota bacterium]
MHKNKNLIVIAGPTASGKTLKAIEMALNKSIEIFSADSRQIYKELHIGVAKPTMNELKLVNHHFINHISIQDIYNAGTYEEEFNQKINTYFQSNDEAILVGGTGFYIQAAIHGLDSFPEVPENILEELDKEYISFGLEPLTEELKVKDFDTFNTIDIKNSRRVLRALSVIRASGKKFSELKSGNKKEKKFNIEYHYIDLPRDQLYERINQRVEDMIHIGLIDEVKSLLPYKHLKSMQTVGYQELFAFFDGHISKEKAIDQIKQNTRNYAKRQVTWFKKF